MILIQCNMNIEKSEIKILLIEHHQVALDGLKSILETEENFKIVGTTLIDIEAVEIKINKTYPDIVVLDVDEVYGIEILEYIKANYPDIKVLILTINDNKDLILKVFQLGVNGYMLKSQDSIHLKDAINAICKGRHYFSSDVMSRIASNNLRRDAEVVLTRRELEVLKLITTGKSSKEISNELFISDPTFQTHRRNILDKLDLKNTVQLVRYAIKNGLVEL